MSLKIMIVSDAASERIAESLADHCGLCGLPLSLHFSHCSRMRAAGPMPDAVLWRPIFTRENDPDLRADVAKGASA